VSTGGERPSYQDLAALVTSQAKTITVLQARVAELERQLGLNSQNSSKPPSSDSPFAKPVKPAPRSLRGRSGRKPGGQPGHPGSTLELVSDPDEVVRHEPGPCGGCGDDLAGAVETGVERRQVFDLPPVRVRVIEHQVITRRCGCGTPTTAAAPAGVSARVQYGPQVAAIVVYLYVGQFLSRERTAQAVTELFGTPISPATVAALTRRAAAGLDGAGGFLDQVADRIADAQVAGFDETGLRVGGGLAWVHVARTDWFTLITCHAKRGRDGIDDAGVLSRFRGVAVHDAWAPYDTYPDITHQLCSAHVLRELRAAAEQAPTRNGWHWATQAGDALVAIQKLLTDAGTATAAATAAAAAAAVTAPAAPDPDQLAGRVHAFRAAAQIGAAQTRTRRTPLMAKHHALARRLVQRHDDYLRFVHDPQVPPDNNGSERDIRMIKLRQKVSGCLRTLTGAQQFCAIRSYLSTAAKHGRHFLDTLVMLAEGRPWLPTPA
jgi:transposase